jgi:hypothetical protein
MRPFLIAGLALVACAAPKPRLTQPWDAPQPRASSPEAPGADAGPSPVRGQGPAPAPDPAAASPERSGAELARLVESNPAAWAARYKKGAECEAAARAVRNASADSGWRALGACVAKGEFRAFARLTDGFWDADLQTRSDAPTLLGAVIAVRGADLESDLTTLKKRRVPFFSLEAATSQPKVYRGRPVAFIARVEGMEQAARGRAVAQLAELSLVSRSAGRITTARFSGAMKQDEHGRNYTEKGHYLGTVTRTNYENALDETGVRVQAFLSKMDPFFEPGGTFLVVGRFDGMVGDQDSLDGEQPAVTVAAYYTIGTQSLLD